MSLPSAAARSGRGRGRGRGLGDTRREAVEAAAARARNARRRALLSGGKEFADGTEDDDDAENDAPDVTHDPDAPIFADAPYEDDDQEAEEIYAAVQKRMQSRRQKHTEARIQHDLEEYRKANPSVPQQFADLKRKLCEVSEEDWAAVPEVGDRSVQRRRLEKYIPAPDMLLQTAAAGPGVMVAAGQEGGTSSSGVSQAAEPRRAVSTDLARISEGRSSVIGHKLDTASDSVTGQTNIDPKGYLTQMAGMHITSDSEVSDIKKARALLKSVTTTNPKHAPGWIAAARLEEVAGKYSIARKVISDGCQHCPTQEDVWLEAARLHPPAEAKVVLARAVQHVPKSVKVWLHATAIEGDIQQKKRVLRMALQVLPGSAKLWRTFVDLEDPAGAQILLSRAVECVPNELDLWLALARLETYDKAKAVLNRALGHVGAEPAVWVTGAKLEESQLGTFSMDHFEKVALEVHPKVSRLLERAVSSLSVDDDIVKRERWLQEARDAEEGGFPVTCQAIINACLGVGIEVVDQRRIWEEDAAAAAATAIGSNQGRKSVGTARAIHRKIVSSFPGEEEVWRSFAEFEQQHGTAASSIDVLDTAVKYCPRAEVLWLMAAKLKWTERGVEVARDVLNRAFLANPESEKILLAASKVELEVGETDRARLLLAKARKAVPSARVVMKSALLERRTRCADAELELLDAGVDAYPDSPKLWLMVAQYHERAMASAPRDSGSAPRDSGSTQHEQQVSQCRSVYARGLSLCSTCAALWCGLALLEERVGRVTKARAALERGRQACSVVAAESEAVWEESVLVEYRSSGRAAAAAMVSRALRAHGRSGGLWALAIALEPRGRQRARSVDGLKRADQSARVLTEAAKLLWRERKARQAREWLARAAAADRADGDALAALWRFERELGGEEGVRAAEKAAEKDRPRYGRMWTAVSKLVGNEALAPVEILRKVGARVCEDTLRQKGFGVLHDGPA